jgi:hypothetical protein
MADVAMPAVTNANIKLSKSVFLTDLISSPPSDLRPEFKLRASQRFRSLAGSLRESPVAGKG